MQTAELVPITRDEARAFLRDHHRHLPNLVGWKFGVGLHGNGALVGCIVAGRPVSRMLDDKRTLEITRCCTLGDKNAASALMGAVARIARDMGYLRLITYTLPTESGASLRAAGFDKSGTAGGGEWTRPSRNRAAATVPVSKIRWTRDFQAVLFKLGSPQGMAGSPSVATPPSSAQIPAP